MGQPSKFDLALERARERNARSPLGSIHAPSMRSMDTLAYTGTVKQPITRSLTSDESARLATQAESYSTYQADNREYFKRTALLLGYDKPVADDMKLIDLPFTVDESDPRRNAYNERKESPKVRHTDDTAVNGRVSVSQFDSPNMRNDAHDNTPDESLASDKPVYTYADVKRSRSTWLNFRNGINALISTVKQQVTTRRDQQFNAGTQ
jgi:hypothetical protein